MLFNVLAGMLVLIYTQLTFADSTQPIIGGTLATDPYLKAGTVGIKMGRRPEDGFCTGTYIGNNKVLTAAHCAVGIEEKRADSLVVFVLPDQKQVKCDIDQIYQNPLFVGSARNPDSTWWEDIAVLKIKCDDLDLSQVRPVALATNARTNDWEKSLVAGYGTNSAEDGCGGFCAGPPPTFPRLMQHTKDQAYAFEDDPEFRQKYPEFMKGIEDGKLVCFKASVTNGSFFIGDSGGPTVEKDLTRGAVQLGIHSVILVNTDRKPIFTCDVAVAPFYEWVVGL